MPSVPVAAARHHLIVSGFAIVPSYNRTHIQRTQDTHGATAHTHARTGRNATLRQRHHDSKPSTPTQWMCKYVCVQLLCLVGANAI